MKNCVMSVSALLLCAGLGADLIAGEPIPETDLPPVAVWPADLEYDPSLVDLSEPETPEWVERLRNSRGEPDCELVGDPDEFDYVVRLTTWPGLVPNRIVYIDASAPLGGDGSSWSNAYQSLHDALNAENFDTELVDIRMAQGVYRADRVNGVDTLDPDLTYELPDITVTEGIPTGVMRIAGGFAGRNAKNPDERDSELYPTVFTGDLLGDDTDQHENYEDNTRVMFEPGLTELNGITIEHGRIAIYEGRWITDCTVRWCYAAGDDIPVTPGSISPVYVKNARVFRSTFSNNRGDRYGGALKPDGSTVVVAGSRFIRNAAPTGAAIGSDYNQEWTNRLIVQNCFFSGNAADSNRGGYAGAVFSAAIDPSFTQIIHCTFTGNEVVAGGGIACVASLNSFVSFNSIYDQNFAYDGTGVESEITIFTFGTNLSQVSGNVFRRYNENLDGNQIHPGYRDNHESVAGFSRLFGADGEFGTADDDPSLGLGSESIGRAISPPAFNNAQVYELGLFDIADLDGDCDRTELLPIDIFGNPRAFESYPGEGINGYAADAGCAEFIPGDSEAFAQDWIVPDRAISDYSDEPVRFYVDLDAAPGGDGSTWSKAFTNPADALAIARSRVGPVEIWVAEGDYVAPLSPSGVGAFQMVHNATLLGGFAGTESSSDQRDPSLHQTVLTGDMLGNDDPGDPSTYVDNRRQVLVTLGRRGGGVVDGFRLTGGSPSGFYAFGAGLFTTSGNGLQGERSSGIVYAASGTLTLRNCEIGPIPLRRTSGVLEPNPMVELHGQMSNLVLEDSIITSPYPAGDSSYASVQLNRFQVRAKPSNDWGNVDFKRNVILDVPLDRRAIRWVFGGYIRVTSSRIFIRRDIFLNAAETIADSRGLILRDSMLASPFRLQLIARRTPIEVNGFTVVTPDFAGLVNAASPAEQFYNIHNTVFYAESVGVTLPSSNPTISLSGNTFPASFAGNISQAGPTNTTFDFANNAADFFIDPLGPDGEPYTGDEDLRLAPGSPAINAGLNEFVTSEFDLDGNDRIIGSVVDRGAYEFTGTCTGDVNGDGEVNLGDLNLVLANFGQTVPFGDASGDGAVDLADLNLILAAFGNMCSD